MMKSNYGVVNLSYNDIMNIQLNPVVLSTIGRTLYIWFPPSLLTMVLWKEETQVLLFCKQLMINVDFTVML